MKRLVSLLMVLALLCCIVPVPAVATSNITLEVTVNNAPVRSAPRQEGNVVARCASGSVLFSTGSTINYRMNKWYKVNYNGSTCYIYSGNVKQHSHSYDEMNMNGVTYKICDCGDVRVSYVSTEAREYKEGCAFASTASSVALSQYSPYLTVAGGSAAADGPIPIGDAIGIIILVYGAYKVMVSSSITDQMLVDIAQEVSFSDYLRSKDRENVCTDTSFRMVNRMPDNLHYANDRCLNVLEAYVAARYMNCDVYTSIYDVAYSCASLCKEGSFSEIDSNKPDYYYHFHFGPDHDHQIGSSHVFYGASPSGKTPV